MQESDAHTRNSSLLKDKEASDVGNQCLRLATRGRLGAKQSSRKVRAEESKLVVKRSSRRWGGSDLYSGHCTKLPHLIGHLRCLREELASSTGMEGVGERTGGNVIMGKAPHTQHSHVHTHTPTQALSKSVWLHLLSSLIHSESSPPFLKTFYPLLRPPAMLVLPSSLPGPKFPAGWDFSNPLTSPFFLIT